MQTRELAAIAIFTSLSVSGRIGLAFIPNVSLAFPAIFISAIMFGYKVGGFVGLFTYLISDLYFGWGPWTIINAILAASVGIVMGIVRKRLSNDTLILGLAILFLTMYFDILSSVINMAIFNVDPIIAIIGLFTPVFISGIPYPMGPVHEISNAIITVLIFQNITRNHDIILKYLGGDYIWLIKDTKS